MKLMKSTTNGHIYVNIANIELKFNLLVAESLSQDAMSMTFAILHLIVHYIVFNLGPKWP